MEATAGPSTARGRPRDTIKGGKRAVGGHAKISGVGVGQLSRNGIEDMLSHDAQPTLQVISIRRFMRDSRFDKAIGLSNAPPYDMGSSNCAYDMVLSDGALKRKCLLFPSLNPMIESGELVNWSVVRLLSAKIRWDESDPLSSGVCMVTGLEMVSTAPDTLLLRQKLKQLSFEDEYDEKFGDVPSFGYRSTYIHLTRDDDIQSQDEGWLDDLQDASEDDLDAFVGVWSNILEKARSNSPESSYLSQLGHLADVGPKHKEYKRDKRPPLLLCVTGKEQLRWINTEKQGLPAKPALKVSDGICEAVVVLWFEATRKFYFNINIGDVVLVDGYVPRNVRPAFLPKPTKFFDECNIELAINTRNPPATIKKISDLSFFENFVSTCEDTPLRDSLPDLLEQIYSVPTFTPRARLTALADKQIVSLCGMLLRVGRERRIRSGPSSQPRFYSYRWLAIRDSSTLKSTYIRLYNCSQSTEFDFLIPGMAFVGTNLELHSCVEVSKNGCSRILYLTSTPMTRYEAWFPETTSDPTSRPYFRSQAVVTLCDWINSPEAIDAAKTGATGGYEFWIPSILNSPFIDYDEQSTGMKYPTMVEIANKAKTMHLKESMRLSAVATISSIGYVNETCDVSNWSRIDEDTKKTGKRRKVDVKSSLAPGSGVQIVETPQGVQEYLQSNPKNLFPENIRGQLAEDIRAWQIVFVGLNQDAVIEGLVPAGFTAYSTGGSRVESKPEEQWGQLCSIIPKEIQSAARPGKRPSIDAIKRLSKELAKRRFIVDLDIYKPNYEGIEVVIRQIREVKHDT